MLSLYNVFSYFNKFIKGLINKKKELNTLYDQVIVKNCNFLTKL